MLTPSFAAACPVAIISSAARRRTP
jgi:hypothetical protein